MPKLTKTYHLNFYGGEALLSFDLIKKTITSLNKINKELKKRGNYSITTNGSLLTKEIIKFLNENKFSVVLSYDGLAQDIQRKKGSSKKIIDFIYELLNYPDIDLEINSVFTSRTVDCISESIKFIMELGVRNINFSISIVTPWDRTPLLKLKIELTKLRRIVLAHYKRKGNIPIINFREKYSKGIFYCAAGKDRLAITPEGGIWGCFLFPDYFKGKENLPEYQKYYFGNLVDFTENYKIIYPRISTNYARLSMDYFYTPKMECYLCSELENCAVCPINASLSDLTLGKIPQYVCEIQKIKIREKENFTKEFQRIKNNSIN